MGGKTRCAGRPGLAYCGQVLNGMIMPRSLTVLFLSGLCLCLSAAGADRAPVVADGFAALVNDRVVTVSDVLMLVQQGEPQRQALYEGAELERKRKQDFEAALNALIDQALILEDFEQQEAVIPERAVDEYLESMIRERFDNDRGAFLAGLAEERMTLEDYRKQIRDRLIIMVSRQQILRGNIFVAPSAARKVYEERADVYGAPESVHMRMMTFKAGQAEEEQAARRADAESIRAQLADGADFAELAMAHSQDSRAKQGGDWGWVAVRDLAPAFAEALKPLQPGDLSDVISSGGDLYILKLEDRRESSVRPFDEVKDQIEKELRTAEEERIYREWIARLRKKHSVKIFQ